MLPVPRFRQVKSLLRGSLLPRLSIARGRRCWHLPVMRRFVVVAAALVFVPSAFAWTTLGGSVLPQAVPSLIVRDPALLSESERRRASDLDRRRRDLERPCPDPVAHHTGVESAAVLPDGTPVFSQAQIAFYSNADPDGATVYEPLGADLSPASSTPLKPIAEHEAPLVADHSGNTFLAWAPGYPSATSISVVPFRAGSAAGDGVSFRGPFSGGDPHVALAVDTHDRLWTIWTRGSAVLAARSRSHGAHFGATVTVPMPATAHGIAAVALAGTPGSADVVINTGSSLIEQRLQPGLSVRVTKTTKKVGKVKIVTRWAQALDDGFAVPTATFRIARRTYHANAAGKAKVPAGSGKAAAPGYVGASFHA
jgi:hypothetical protein